jgi:hypothetical protein
MPRPPGRAFTILDAIGVIICMLIYAIIRSRSGPIRPRWGRRGK